MYYLIFRMDFGKLTFQDGHGNLEAGCEECNCDHQGSTSERCNPVTGQCGCKKGVIGLRCDVCEKGHFDLTDIGKQTK